MPSPIAHSLIGCATGILFLVPRGAPPGLVSRLWNVRGWLLGGVVVANAPDIDFLPGIPGIGWPRSPSSWPWKRPR